MILSASILRLAALSACAVIIAVVLMAPGPDGDFRSAVAIHDYGHVIAFSLVTILFAFTLSAHSRGTFQARIVAICMAAGAALALGAAVEVAQAVIGLWGDPWDVVRDGAGTLAAVTMLVARDRAISSRVRVACAGATIFTLFGFAYPIFSALMDETLARTQFPILASFASKNELARFNFSNGVKSQIVLTTDVDGQPVSAVRLQLPPDMYPGIELSYFPRDWRGMRVLRLLIVNSEPTPLEMSMQIDDAKYDSKIGMSDRYNRSFSLSPGTTRIEIPLSEVSAALHNRQFDLERVQSVLVFAVDLKKLHNIVIGPIVLLP